MAENTTDPVEQTQPAPVTEPAKVQPAPEFDPAEVAYLRDYHTQTRPLVEMITPIYDDVTEFASNAELRDLWKSAKTAYTATTQKEDQPDWAKALTEKSKKIDEIAAYADTLKARDVLATQAQELSSVAAKYPALAENDYAKLRELSEKARKAGIQDPAQFVSLVREIAPDLQVTAPKKSTETPPPSLRGEASVPGVATEPVQKVSNKAELHKYLQRTLRSGGRS